jgi:hypothetical protein
VLKGVGKGALERIEDEDLFGPFRALYDLKNDPGEVNDVAGDHPDRVAQMLEMLDRGEATARLSYVEYQSDRRIDPETLSELEMLGYTGDED